MKHRFSDFDHLQGLYRNSNVEAGSARTVFSKGFRGHRFADFQSTEYQVPLARYFPEYEKQGALMDEENARGDGSEEEDITDYKKGGYHPIFVGEILNGRYVILSRLGWGHFSTVWLARDVKYNTYVAVKVQKSAAHYMEAAFDEVEILQKAVKYSHDEGWIKDLHRIYGAEKDKFGVEDCHVVQLLNAFIYQGPYGRHFCMVFEILGVNLLEIMRRYEYKGVPLPICRRITKQVLIGLHYLHRYCNIIHTDLKPENVMVCLTQAELREIFESGEASRARREAASLQVAQRKLAELNGVREQGEEAKLLKQPSNPYLLPTGEKATLWPGEGRRGEEVRLSDMTEPEAKTESTPVPRPESGLRGKEFMFEVDEEPEVNSIRKSDKVQPIFTEEDLDLHLEMMTKALTLPTDSEKKTFPVEEPSHRLLNEYEKIQREKSGLAEDFQIKIVDLGNGCWSHHHFQPQIQTRQYRSPEVILGINYNETADIWSLACMLFELLTGEFLFDPRKRSNWSKSSDHLMLMMSMLRPFPRNFMASGVRSKKYLDREGKLKGVPKVSSVTLKGVLTQKFRANPCEAELLADFLSPMLAADPTKRISALEALNHPWLSSTSSEFFNSGLDSENSERPPHGVPDDEDFDADKSNASFVLDDSDVETESEPAPFEHSLRHVDRSFKTVYVGYDEGIDLNGLDNTANWQFDPKWQ